tara:strand:+ start:405 stop:683 length:279 start_codon:yes stop_codon:yes gene_type:complete
MRYILTKLSSGYLASSTYIVALGMSGITTIGTRHITIIRDLNKIFDILSDIFQTFFKKPPALLRHLFNEAPPIIYLSVNKKSNFNKSKIDIF